MTLIFLIFIIFGTIWLSYVYIGYPACLWLIGQGLRFQPLSREEFMPSISVLISARNEERDIGWKIQETVDWDYPADQIEVLIASDASQDGTDEVVRGFNNPRVKLVRLDPRVGKNEALNQLAKVATGDLFFFTDANSHIGAHCARRLARHFADPRVGCVTGADRTIDQKGSAIGVGEASYWNYELQLQRLESRIGSVLICFGAIFCIRRSLFVPLQADLANDLELPLRIGSSGFALLFEPNAWAAEKATHSAKEEFDRRARICGQGLLGFWRLRKLLKGLRAWQFITRKFLRWLTIVPLLLVFAGTLGLASIPTFRAMFLIQLAFYVLALLGWLLTALRLQNTWFFALPFYFILVNAAGFWGLIEACRGRRYRVWEVASLTRGPVVGGALSNSGSSSES